MSRKTKAERDMKNWKIMADMYFKLYQRLFKKLKDFLKERGLIEEWREEDAKED